MFASVLAGERADPGNRYGFVSANVTDFSAVDGDDRQPHPDLAEMFASPRSHYFTSLTAALGTVFPDEFDELLDEFDIKEEPRTFDEIRVAEQELFDRIWYQRSLAHERDDGADLDDLRRIAGPGRARVEETYGRDDLSPYTDFAWGMLNGKMSALRWVLGSEWDFLDT
jgi:hypothetical protein